MPTFRFTELGSNLANPLYNNIHYAYNMQKEYVIQFYKTINKLLCNLSFAGQYILYDDEDEQMHLMKKGVKKIELCCAIFVDKTKVQLKYG